MRDAAMFPFYASGALFGLYVIFKVCFVYSFVLIVIISLFRIAVPSQRVC